MKRTIFIIITLLTLTLPMATLADSPRRDDESRKRTSRDDDKYKRRDSRDDDDHDQFHRGLLAEYRNYRQYNRIEDRGDWFRYRRFLRYLEAKHRRVHRHFCDECWRVFSIINRDNHFDNDFAWVDQRRHDRGDRN